MKKEERVLSTAQERVLSSIIEILDTAFSGGVEALNLLYEEDVAGAQRFLEDLDHVTYAVRSAQETLLPLLEHAFTTEQLDNIEETLQSIHKAIDEGNLLWAQHLTEYQLIPFIRLLLTSFHFWGTVMPDRQKIEEYYKEEFAQYYRNPYISDEAVPDYQLSIVIPAYNHLEKTKTCIQSVLQNTDFEQLNAELILIDHGSSDGTLEYFRSIPNATVIHIKNNVRMYMFALASMVCKGEFLALINNDTILSERWADQLLTAIQSDSHIALVSPLTPNTSNLQAPIHPDNDPTEFIEWANQNNHSDTLLWSDRARVLPTIGVYRTKVLQKIGFADPYYYSMEFWDDDLSLRIRRARFRQVLCEDTVCYHFGSVTGSAGVKRENTLVYGQDLFRKKNGVNAWGNGFCYDYYSVNILFQCLQQKQSIDFLGIDCGFGDTPLQLRNLLRRKEKHCTLFNMTTQPEYVPDLNPLSDHFFYASECISSALPQAFPGQAFDVIYLGQDMAEYSDYENLIYALPGKLVPGGYAVFRVENPWYILNVFSMLNSSLPDEKERVCWISPVALRSKAENVFSQVQVLTNSQEISGMKDFIYQHYTHDPQELQTLIKQFAIKSYYFVCKK